MKNNYEEIPFGPYVLHILHNQKSRVWSSFYSKIHWPGSIINIYGAFDATKSFYFLN